MLLIYAVIIGIALGLITGGKLDRLGGVRFRLWPVALAGLAFQAVLFSSPVAESVGRLGPSLYVLSTVLVLMALVVNMRQPGIPLVITGAVLNFVVIIANGGQMPASPEAMASLISSAGLDPDTFANSVPMTGAVLPFLGDIFVLPRPFPFANVFSIGDVLIGVGGAWFVVKTMHRHVVDADAAGLATAVGSGAGVAATARPNAQTRASHG
jgi:hypothetical protein